MPETINSIDPNKWYIMPDEPQNWVSDRDHENGNYQHTCIFCKRAFMGHKRRCVCRICADESFTEHPTHDEDRVPKSDLQTVAELRTKHRRCADHVADWTTYRSTLTIAEVEKLLCLAERYEDLCE